MMKLLGSNKSETTKDKNGENMPNLEVMKVVLVHYNTANNCTYNTANNCTVHLLLLNHLVKY